MFALLSQRRLRWLGHVGHIERIPKEILYGELKRDLKAGNISPAGWVAIATERSHWRLAVKAGTQAGEEKKERRRLREASQSYDATTATEPTDPESDCTYSHRQALQLNHWLNLGADSIVSRDRWMPTSLISQIYLWTTVKQVRFVSVTHFLIREWDAFKCMPCIYK